MGSRFKWIPKYGKNGFDLIKNNPRKAVAGTAGAVGLAAALDNAGGSEEPVVEETPLRDSVKTTPVKAKYEDIPSLEAEIDKMFPVPDDVKMTKEEEAKRKEFSEGIKNALIEADNTKDAERKAAIIETLGHAFARIGAGAAGLKSGVDLSKLDLTPTDWRARRREDEADIERRKKYLDANIASIDKDVQQRRDERQRATERRQNALASAKTAAWSELTQRQREAVKLEEAQQKNALITAAKKDAELSKVISGVDLAQQLKRQAELEPDEGKKLKLIGDARETLAKSGISSATISKYFDEIDNPGFLARLFGAKPETKLKELESIDLTPLRNSLLAPPKQPSGSEGKLDMSKFADVPEDQRAEVKGALDYINDTSKPQDKRNKVRQTLKDRYGI